MCGIAGYYGKNICEDILLNFLSKLEYRGYDSSGIAIKKNNKINIIKNSIKVNELKQQVHTKTKDAIGIAHTRWATHGNVTKENAHPVSSENGVWHLVHNGIIENYLELKQELSLSNVTFKGETDSEVVAQLLEYENVNNINDFIATISKLKGSFAICAFNNFDNTLYLAKNKSPLYIATKNSDYYIASDPVCFAEITNEYYSLNDNEYCIVFDNNLCFYNNKCNIISKKLNYLNFKYTKTSKENYSTFMEKEINEIPKVLKNIINEYGKYNYFKPLNNVFKDVKNITIIGCGTAYHSGLIGATYLQNTLNVNAYSTIASEFICSNPIVDKNNVYIFVSQSGETADTLNALNMVKHKCKTTIAITNVTYSTLAKSCDIVLPVFAGPEIAVASTKAYNAQLFIFYLLSIYLKRNNLPKSLFKKLLKDFECLNINELYYFKNLESLIANCDNLFLLGKHDDYFTAMEASLKIREITYTNCASLPSGELKHGTLALVSKDTLCFVISTNNNLHSKNTSSINEIKSRGGKVVLVTNNVKAFNDSKCIDYIIELPNIDSQLVSIVSVIPFQLIALQYSLFKGINPDQPRNLAKSVTVE